MTVPSGRNGWHTDGLTVELVIVCCSALLSGYHKRERTRRSLLRRRLTPSDAAKVTDRISVQPSRISSCPESLVELGLGLSKAGLGGTKLREGFIDRDGGGYSSLDVAADV